MKRSLFASVLALVVSKALVGAAVADAIPDATFYAGFDTADSVDSERFTNTTVTLTIPGHPAASATGHLDLSDPSLTVSATNLDATISTNAFFQLYYDIEFMGPDGTVPVMVQSIGNATSGGQAALFVYRTNFDGTSNPIAFTGSNADNTYDTNNEIMQFDANVLYTVQLFTYVANSGTAYIDPTFTPTGPNASQYSFNTNLSLGDGNVGTIPLPASAPMFGAALLTLIATGYGRKRKKAVTVA